MLTATLRLDTLTDTIIITHRDLDGIAAAALYVYCKKALQRSYRILYTEPDQLSKILRKFYSRGVRYVIIDIGLNRDVYDELNSMDLNSLSIEWYDHHVWDENWLKKLRAKGLNIYVDRSTCGTGVVAKSVCSDEGRVRDLVEIVCGADMWNFQRYESTFLFRYADVENDDEWRHTVFNTVAKYLNGEISCIVDHTLNEVSRYVDVELEKLSLLPNEVEKILLDGISICVYVKEYRIPSASIIGNLMLSMCDIALIVNESLNRLSFRSSKCNVRDLALVFGGGGHVRAAGAPLKTPLLYKVFKSLSPEMTRRGIVNEIIRKIKEAGISLRDLCRGET